MDIRIVVSAGIIIFAYSFYLLTDADEYTAFWVLTMIVVLGRFGIGLVMPPLNVAALKNLPPELLHQGSGAYNFLRQLGGAFGVNLLAVLLQLRTDYHYDSLSATQRFDNSTTQSMLYEVKQVLAQQGLTFVEQNYLATQYLAQLIYKQALTLGFKDSFWAVVVSFMVIMLPILAIRDKSPATSSSPASQTQSSDDDAPPAMPDPDDPAPHTARS
jgi:MFS family permease